MFRVIRAWWQRRKRPISVPQDTPMTERLAISTLDRLRGDELPCGNHIDYIMLRFLIENGHRKLGRTWCSAKERDALAEWEQQRSPPTKGGDGGTLPSLRYIPANLLQRPPGVQSEGQRRRKG